MGVIVWGGGIWIYEPGVQGRDPGWRDKHGWCPQVGTFLPRLLQAWQRPAPPGALDVLSPGSPATRPLSLQSHKLMGQVWTLAPTSWAPGPTSSPMFGPQTEHPVMRCPSPLMGAPSYKPSVVGGMWGQLSLSHRQKHPGHVCQAGKCSGKGEAPEATRAGGGAQGRPLPVTQPLSCWLQHMSPEKTDSAQAYLLWRRDSQQHEVAEEEGHELLPQPRASARVHRAGQTARQQHP